MPEKQGEMPFYESAEDATYSAILDSRKPVKEVAHALWPHLHIDSAYARLKGALKSERPEKLTAGEHIFIANYCQQFHFLYYCEKQLHHSGSTPVAPEDEQLRLQQIIIQGQRELTQAMNRYNALRPGAK
jgi:hypothetical protein